MPTDILLIDEYEPDEVETLLAQSLKVARVPLNRSGLADYSWRNYANKVEHVERKQVHEILGGFEEVEYQLTREINTSPYLTLLIQGVALPSADGIDVYQPPKGVNAKGGILYRAKHYKTPWARYEGWLAALDVKGIRIWRVPNIEGVVIALERLYVHTRTPDSLILQRHLKVPTGFHPNPHVHTLMGITNAGIGPKLAEALINTYTTPWNMLNHTAEEIADFVPGVGVVMARKILTAFGKDDV